MPWSIKRYRGTTGALVVKSEHLEGGAHPIQVFHHERYSGTGKTSYYSATCLNPNCPIGIHSCRSVLELEDRFEALHRANYR